MLAIGATAVAASLVVAAAVDRPDLFARSGALAILTAVAVETRVVLRTHYYPQAQAMFDWLAGLPVPRGLSRTGERIALAAHGAILAGTLIWAYGDLLLG